MKPSSTIAHDKQGFLVGHPISLKTEQHIANIDRGIQEVKQAVHALSRMLTRAQVRAPVLPTRKNIGLSPTESRSKQTQTRLNSPQAKRINVKAIAVQSLSKPVQHGTQRSASTDRVTPRLAVTPKRQSIVLSPTSLHQTDQAPERLADTNPLRDANGRFLKRSGAQKAVMPYGVSDSKRLQRTLEQQSKNNQANSKDLLGFLKGKQRKDTQAHNRTDTILGKLLDKPAAIIKNGASRTASAGFGMLDDIAGGGLSVVGGMGKGALRLLKRVPVLGKLLALGGLAVTAQAALGDESNEAQASNPKQVWAKGAGGFVGGSLGMWGGATAGAAVGSVIPVVGTAIGGVVGAVLGGIGGDAIGESVGEWLYARDWKTGWSKVRSNVSTNWSNLTQGMSNASTSAWATFSSVWPRTAQNLESTFDSLKSTFLARASQMFDSISAGYDGAKQWGQNNIMQPLTDGFNGTTNGQQGAIATVAGAMGSGARVAGDWIQTNNPFSYAGLKLKRGATGGGATANGVTAMAHAVDGKFGKDVLRHAALNDRYHHGLNYRSLHADGLGFDTTFDSANQMQAKGLHNGRNTAAAQRYSEIKAYVESMGFKVGGKGSDIELIDEYNKKSKKATGGHIHFAFRNRQAAKRYEDMVRTGNNQVAQAGQQGSDLRVSTRDKIRSMFGMTPKHSADKNANIKVQGAKRADAALDFTGGTINGLSDAQTHALMASKQETEASFNPNTINRSGYVGLYQFGAAALEDIGLLKKGTSKGGNAAMSNNANWTMAGGKTAFLNDKALQDQMAVKYANILLQRGIGAGALNKGSAAEAKAGYIKAAWLKGNGGANDWVLRGKDSKDGMGTSAAKYYNDGVNAVKFDAPILQAASVPTVRYDVPKAQASQSTATQPTKLNSDASKTRIDYQTVMATQEVSDRGLAHIASGGIGRNLGVN